MTIINGANNHSVEDLLSSIRHSIADDTGIVRQGPSSPLNHPPLNNSAHNTPMARREQPMPDESAEFELPAIFKPGHHNQHTDRPNLFGRLSDALKPVPQPEPDRSRTVIRFEPAAGRMIEPPAVASAQPSRPGQPPEQQDDPAAKLSAENNAVGRVMPSFFDTRLNKLGEMTRQASTPKPVEPPPQPAPQAVAPQPPPLRPQPPAADAGASGLEDAAAQLLRPILKQWLMDNMPKIVEKALRSEAGDDFPPVQTPPERRK